MKKRGKTKILQYVALAMNVVQKEGFDSGIANKDMHQSLLSYRYKQHCDEPLSNLSWNLFIRSNVTTFKNIRFETNDLRFI